LEEDVENAHFLRRKSQSKEDEKEAEV